MSSVISSAMMYGSEWSLSESSATMLPIRAKRFLPSRRSFALKTSLSLWISLPAATVPNMKKEPSMLLLFRNIPKLSSIMRLKSILNSSLPKTRLSKSNSPPAVRNSSRIMFQSLLTSPNIRHARYILMQCSLMQAGLKAKTGSTKLNLKVCPTTQA